MVKNKNISDEYKDKIRRFPEGQSGISKAKRQRMAAEELLEDPKEYSFSIDEYPDKYRKLKKEQILDLVREEDDDE